MNCIHLHPAVSDKLNDRDVGDFLIWNINDNPETTRRLSCRHQKAPCGSYIDLVEWSSANAELLENAYTGRNSYRCEKDYVEHFVELLDQAVNDRLRINRVGVFMSGGMDSTTIAATVNKLLLRKNESFNLQAYTIVYDRLIPDEERFYSRLVAERIGIPINYTVAGDYQLTNDSMNQSCSGPEPSNFPTAAIFMDQYSQIERHTRVMLAGQGGEAVLRGSFSYLINLFKSFRFGRAALSADTS